MDRIATNRVAAEHLQLAIEASGKGDRYKTIHHLTEIINVFPEISDLYTHRGSEYYGIKEYDKAIIDLSYSLSLNPNNSQALLNLAASKKEIGDMRTAFKLYTKAILIDPDNPHLWHNRAHIRRYAMDYNGAYIDFKKAVALGSENAEKWVQTCETLGSNISLDNEEDLDKVMLNLRDYLDEGRKLYVNGDVYGAYSLYKTASELYPEMEGPTNHAEVLARELGIE